MTLVSEIADRLEARVPALTGRVDKIAALAAIIAEGAMPQSDVAAFVCPLGFDDRGGDAAAGATIQSILDSIAVVLCIKTFGDAAARAAVPTIDQLQSDVVQAIVGWAPDDVVGVFRAMRGRLLNVNKGLVIYQIDFAVLDEVRVT